MSKGRMQAGSCTAGMRREEVEALIRAANLVVHFHNPENPRQ